MLMKSEVEMRQNDWPNALKTLEQAYELPGVKDSLSQDVKGGKKYSLPFG
jgi:hypothetical protein